MPPSAIVYCETNWLVALAFPHHQHHRLARDLLERARRSECELRLPYAALLEAPHPINEEGKRLANAFTVLRDELANAVVNGEAAFSVITTALNSDAMNKYLARPALTVLDHVSGDAAIKQLRDHEAVLGHLDEIRGRLNFRGRDTFDLYLLAAIIGDRMGDGEMDRPAIFFSTNKKEFRPKSDPQAKMPDGFYEPYRIIWREDFDLEPAVRHWTSEYAGVP
jgi:predicted nucleic acid-binding protein